MHCDNKSAHWAGLIIDELVLQKIDYFCIAPGSRNTPLVLAAARHPQAKTMVHYDERGVGFHALGYGMGKKCAACVIVTSGTAIANLLPALMEAHYSHIPLLILTADRPPELRDCGSNQTVHQVKLFSEFVRWEFDLPCPEDSLTEGFLRETISYASYKTRELPSGPVHINCMLREPLYSSEETAYSHSLPKTQYFSFPAKIDAPLPFSPRKKGLILLGRMQKKEALPAIFQLAKHLQWPICADILSEARLEKSPSLISSYDLLLKTSSLPPPEMIFHFGESFISKRLLEWLSQIKPANYSSIVEHSLRYDPSHLFTHRFTVDSLSFCESILKHHSEETDALWLQEWQEKEEAMRETKESHAKEYPSLIEAKAIWQLAAQIPKNWGVFYGNSMPIRDADHFFHPAEKIAGIFSNRGTSGIDGNVATSFGIAQGLKRPLVSCLGDLAFLHDLNSLAQAKTQKYPVLFLVLNNSGGGIFSYLKVAEEKKHFDTYIRAKHDFTFSSIAEEFHLPYQRIENLDVFITHLHHSLAQETSAIIELTVDANSNKAFHSSLGLRAEERLKKVEVLSL